MNKKQNLGQFNTKNDVWLRPHIVEFIKNSDCGVVVDPYAGRGDLLYAVKKWFNEYAGYDIDPDLCTDMGWAWNDSLDHMPFHNDAIVITNPPYLAKNSAARNCLDGYDYFKDPVNERYEDLYQIALQRVLSIYKKAVFIIPETYFQTDLFKGYLHSYTVIEDNPFTDTDFPICVVCFDVHNDFFSISNNNFKIYKNDNYLFDKYTLDDILFKATCNMIGTVAYRVMGNITFNDPNGNLGLRGVDGVDPNDKIRFVRPSDLDYSLEIKESSRSITIIKVAGVPVNNEFIETANNILNDLRKKTHDVVLSPFKNNNKLGVRRRRLDYHWARKIIEKTIGLLDK